MPPRVIIYGEDFDTVERQGAQLIEIYGNGYFTAPVRDANGEWTITGRVWHSSLPLDQLKKLMEEHRS